MTREVGTSTRGRVRMCHPRPGGVRTASAWLGGLERASGA